ncbi:hypothetical protein BDZ89DRAFT_1068689 [Hymenopellis radicata]|nr:hypothetical protein BDZ89DRAFT_1068689 [Hymenopellis radicata]
MDFSEEFNDIRIEHRNLERRAGVYMSTMRQGSRIVELTPTALRSSVDTRIWLCLALGSPPHILHIDHRPDRRLDASRLTHPPFSTNCSYVARG